MQRICLIEGSTDFQARIVNELQEWFAISCASSITEAGQLLERENVDLVLLDVCLPDGNGFDFCAKLKNSPRTQNIPVIFLTAKADPLDKVMGFSVGGDDYIAKPFEPLELRARIQARMRRQSPLPMKSDIEIYADLKFDRIKQRVFAIEPDGEVDLNLTPFEFKVLYFLASKPGQFFNKGALLKGVLEPNVYVNEENIYTHISAIRKKLTRRDKYLGCLPRVGYCFSATQKNPCQRKPKTGA